MRVKSTNSPLKASQFEREVPVTSFSDIKTSSTRQFILFLFSCLGPPPTSTGFRVQGLDIGDCVPVSLFP